MESGRSLQPNLSKFRLHSLLSMTYFNVTQAKVSSEQIKDMARNFFISSTSSPGNQVRQIRSAWTY
jgi:hypothetical protein